MRSGRCWHLFLRLIVNEAVPNHYGLDYAHGARQPIFTSAVPRGDHHCPTHQPREYVDLTLLEMAQW